MNAKLRRLTVRSRRVVVEDGSVDTQHTVHCPRADKARAFEHCCGCTHMQNVDIAPDGETGAIECFAGPAPLLPNGRVDVAEAAVRTRIVDVMDHQVTCVRFSVPVLEVENLLTSRRALPVVDGAGRLVGIVSRSDLGRATSPEVPVSEIMTPRVHGLPEEAPIAYAISLMAVEGVHEVPIVSQDGAVVGMITARDALKWVSSALGYVTPAP